MNAYVQISTPRLNTTARVSPISCSLSLSISLYISFSLSLSLFLSLSLSLSLSFSLALCFHGDNSTQASIQSSETCNSSEAVCPTAHCEVSASCPHQLSAREACGMCSQGGIVAMRQSSEPEEVDQHQALHRLMQPQAQAMPYALMLLLC